MTYYDILGVPHDATPEQIKQAYRLQIRFFHPDLFEGSPAVADIKTKQLNEAYGVLGNPELRNQYDRVQKSGTQAPPKQENRSTPPPQDTYKSNFDAHVREARENILKQEKRRKRKAILNSVLVLALAVLFGCFVHHYLTEEFSLEPEQSATEAASTELNPATKAGSSLKLKQSVIDRITYSKQAEQKSSAITPLTMPGNGEILIAPTKEPCCPLSVEVVGDQHYYIYLDCMNGSSNDMSFMVSPNSQTEVLVPLGEYEIYYTSGEQWYGTTYRFGNYAPCFKCDGKFSFYDDGEYYQGWTLELYPQTNGNLDTDKISTDQFPTNWRT